MKNKYQGQEYNLSVSEFARLCNTTRDTLRHYYETGILIPRVDENNGYHYYSSSQISSFYFICTFKNAGCSLKEINTLIHDASKEQLLLMANTKMAEMQEELKRIQGNIITIKNALWLLENYDKHKDSPPSLHTLENITVFKTPVTHKNSASHVGDIVTDIQNHLNIVNETECSSPFPLGVTISHKDLLAQNYVYNNIISISNSSLDKTCRSSLPSTHVVSCYHDHTKDNIEGTYKQIVDFITQKKLTICSDLHIISLINMYNSEQKHTYFKYLFICVE